MIVQRNRSVCALTGTDCRPSLLRRRAGRPQLKRDPLGGDYSLLYTEISQSRVLDMGKQRVVHSDPDILGGTPVFVGTRVPVKTLYDYLAAGDSLAEFLNDFPSVARDQAVAALELGREMTEARATPA